MNNYTAEIFIKKYIKNRTLTGWQKGGCLEVKADSLDSAIDIIKRKSKERFPESQYPEVHLDNIISNGKLVYKTAWDEEGNPLVTVILNK